MKKTRFTFVLFVAFILLTLTSCSGGGGGDSSSTTPASPFEGTWAKTAGTAGTDGYARVAYAFSGANVTTSVTECVEAIPGSPITTTINIPSTFTYDETAKTLTLTVCGAASGTVDPDKPEYQSALTTALSSCPAKGDVSTDSYNFSSATVLELGGIVFTKE